MNQSPALSHIISQLQFQAPVLVVYFVAIVLSIVFFRRAPLPALLTIAGILTLVTVSIAVAGIQGYVIQSQLTQGRTNADRAAQMNMIGLVGSFGRAFGAALLVAAIFVGRKRHEPEEII
jgi:hypothetical protein